MFDLVCTFSPNVDVSIGITSHHISSFTRGNILSGGKDRRVIQWDSEYEKMDEKDIPERYGSVRMISRGQGNMQLIGTTRNCILQGNFEMDFSAMVEGHKEEFWGL